MSAQIASIESEQSVIGAVILDPSAFDRIGDLRAEEFSNAAHALIFEAARRLWLQGDDYDAVTVSERLKLDDKLDFVGGLQYIGALVNAVPTAKNAHRYASIVRDRAKRRGLTAAGVQVAELAVTPDISADEAIAQAVTTLAALSEHGTTGGLVSFSDALTGAMNRSQNPEQSGMRGIMPIDELDRILGGVEPGSLIIVAARPSVGKTVFLTESARKAAKAGYNPAIFSLEMPSEQLAMRMISAASQVPLSEIREGKASKNAAAISDATCKLDALGILIDDTGGLHIDQIRVRARAMHRRRPLGVIYVDYLTLVRGEGKQQTEKVGDVAQKLKTLAKELNCAVIALSQMSRECEKRGDQRGILADLRDSGEIEQAADVVIFLYRDELVNRESLLKGTMELIVRKNRHGSIGHVYATARLDVQRLENMPLGWRAPVVETKQVANGRRQADPNF